MFFLTAQLLPLLRKSEAASVIVIASIAGLANQRAMGSVTYGVSKVGPCPIAVGMAADYPGCQYALSATLAHARADNVAIHLGTLLAGRLQP